MSEEFLTYSNLFTHMGFLIAAYAFLSQYLSFPKDLLSELHRVNRDNSHELPIKSKRIMGRETESEDYNEEKLKEESANKLKVFFIEHDTITFMILSYIIFSILVDGLLMIYLRLHLKDYSFPQWSLFVLPIFYFVLLVGSCAYIMATNKRSWPPKHKKDKYLFLISVLVLFLIVMILISCFAINENFGRLLFINIFGLVALFLYYLVLLAIRMPVSNLLILWEFIITERKQENPK